MNILAIDPGVSNGVAVYANGKYATTIITDPKDFLKFFYPHEVQLTQVVIEQFSAQSINKYGLHTVRIVGGIEMLCGYLSIPIRQQHPQERKAFVDFAVKIARAQGPYVSIGDRHHHQVDALAHLLRFQNDQGLARIKGDSFLLLQDNEWKEIVRL